MAGENVIFTTPKENFIRLINRNVGASNITVESVDRQNKLLTFSLRQNNTGSQKQAGCPRTRWYGYQVTQNLYRRLRR